MPFLPDIEVYEFLSFIYLIELVRGDINQMSKISCKKTCAGWVGIIISKWKQV